MCALPQHMLNEMAHTTRFSDTSLSIFSPVNTFVLGLWISFQSIQPLSHPNQFGEVLISATCIWLWVAFNLCTKTNENKYSAFYLRTASVFPEDGILDCSKSSRMKYFKKNILSHGILIMGMRNFPMNQHFSSTGSTDNCSYPEKASKTKQEGIGSTWINSKRQTTKRKQKSSQLCMYLYSTTCKQFCPIQKNILPS